jgi:hypothetical protein
MFNAMKFHVLREEIRKIKTEVGGERKREREVGKREGGNKRESKGE